MRSNNSIDHELVKSCMQQLCAKWGFTNCDDLVQRDLQFLCEKIEKETGVLISLSTIKRLLNGQFTHMPQIATLDAITKTLGYENWQQFKASSLQKPVPSVKRERNFSSLKYIYWGCGLVVILFGVFYLVNKHPDEINGADKATFSFVKTDGNNLPNTVVFKYNVNGVEADSFFIQQSWDKNRRVKIDKNNHTLTDIYYEPGFHEAKLIANEKIIKTVDVSIPTDRWLFYCKEKLNKGTPRYFAATNSIKDGALQLTVAHVLKGKVDIQKENAYLQVYFPSNINASSDNFVLKFRIKVNKLNDDFCPYFMSEIFCQRKFMYFQSTLKGCTSKLNMQFSEQFLSGKTNDLVALGSDVETWQNVELIVKNKIVSIQINGNKVFSLAYQQSCGLIKGIGFISNGLSAIDFVNLQTIDGKVIYSDDFNEIGKKMK